MAQKPGSYHHVIPSSDGGWYIKKDGAARASGRYDTKQDAVDAALKLTKKQGTGLFIHGKDGKIQKLARRKKE